MAQCVGRNQRTGAQCRRTAPAGATTCHYHDPARLRRPPVSGPPEVQQQHAELRFTTKVLSAATFTDFETLFAAGTGWGRCACLFALDARRVTRGGSWGEQREVNLATMRGLVEQSRSHGVLVYGGGDPIGWCQFVANPQLRFADVASSGADWYITCFVVAPRYRGLAVSAVGLRAAVEAIAARGGGVVEGSATAIAPGPAPKTDRKDLHVADDVLFWGGVGRVRYGVGVDGVGPVAALYRSRRSMHGAPLGGTVDLYEGEGFEAVQLLPRPKSALVDRVLMRRTVPSEQAQFPLRSSDSSISE